VSERTTIVAVEGESDIWFLQKISEVVSAWHAVYVLYEIAFQNQNPM